MESIWAISAVDRPPSYMDFYVTLYFAIFFAVSRFLLDRYLFRMEKCPEAMWELTFHLSAEAWVLSMTHKEPWLFNTRECLVGWPNQDLGLPLKLFYMCQCGLYVYSIAALLTRETWSTMAPVMMSHRIFTVILIRYSYLTRFFRIGSVILALHNASDVFMEASKVFRYSGRQRGAKVSLGLFAISWLILRLIIFPFWVIYSSSHDIRDLLPLKETSTSIMYHVFNTMLLTLLVFHVIWLGFICSTVKRETGMK